MNSKIINIVDQALNELNDTYFDKPIKFNDDIILFGRNGVMDSMAVMQFLVSIEDAIQEEFGLDIELAKPSLFNRKSNALETKQKLIAYIDSNIG